MDESNRVSASPDPIAGMILSGRAATVDEAEEAYLDENLAEVVRLAASDLPDSLFRRHPLIVLLLARGSRGLEDSLM
jgi:hypothetical protein